MNNCCRRLILGYTRFNYRFTWHLSPIKIISMFRENISRYFAELIYSLEPLHFRCLEWQISQNRHSIRNHSFLGNDGVGEMQLLVILCRSDHEVQNITECLYIICPSLPELSSLLHPQVPRSIDTFIHQNRHLHFSAPPLNMRFQTAIIYLAIGSVPLAIASPVGSTPLLQVI